MSNLHISSFGVIPKRNQAGQWRLILDLSSPTGNSVNDGIPKDKFSVQYMKVDDIIDTIMHLGRGTLVAKFDVQSAYRIVPIHPDYTNYTGLYRIIAWNRRLVAPKKLKHAFHRNLEHTMHICYTACKFRYKITLWALLKITATKRLCNLTIPLRTTDVKKTSQN